MDNVGVGSPNLDIRSARRTDRSIGSEVALPILAMAGSIAMKPKLAPTAGTLPTEGPLFVGLLIGVIIIMGGLMYFPAQSLGPIVEHFQVLDVVAKQH